MCSRGLRIFFRAWNQVSYRKNRYRLTANHFEAALYVRAGRGHASTKVS